MWNPKQSNLYRPCKNPHMRTYAGHLFPIWFSLEDCFCLVWFCLGLGGVLYVSPPPRTGRGPFWVFSTTDFFCSASRIGRFSSPRALSRERWPRSRRLVTMFSGACLPGSEDQECAGEGGVHCGHPSDGDLGVFPPGSRSLRREGPHFSLLLLPFPCSATFFLFGFSFVLWIPPPRVYLIVPFCSSLPSYFSTWWLPLPCRLISPF